MTGNAINAKSEALELSSEELDAVSGGDRLSEQAKEEQLKNLEEKKQADALKGFQQALQELP
jgi:hypothetical protein